MPTEETLDQILKDLIRIRKNKPAVDFEEYWKHVRSTAEQERKIFAEEDKKLKISFEALNRRFDI